MIYGKTGVLIEAGNSCGGTGQSGIGDTQEPPCSSVGLIAFAGTVVAVLVLAVGVFAFVYSPGPPDYQWTATSLTIRDPFYPVTLAAADVDADHIQLVNIATDPNWKPVERTNGFSNGHYHSGWSRVANGRKVRMYWAASTRLVLLPPKGSGSAVLLEVHNPENFMRDLCHQWSKRCA